MTEPLAQAQDHGAVEQLLQQELLRADALVGTVAPILHHLLVNDDQSVFADDVLARVRGMVRDIAGQLYDAVALAGGSAEPVDRENAAVSALTQSLLGQAGLVKHCHALALEWQLTQRMQSRLGLDPVLSPMLQALIASTDGSTAGVAMALLAAQARFAQQQRRMALPLSELPGDQLHQILLCFRNFATTDAEFAAAESAVRGNHDEARSRLGLLARVVAGMGGGATAALSVSHAGAALFLTGLAFGSGQDREMAVLATSEGQLARLAIALRAAGLKPQAIEEAVAVLHPDLPVPAVFGTISADQAAALLASSAAFPGQ